MNTFNEGPNKRPQQEQEESKDLKDPNRRRIMGLAAAAAGIAVVGASIPGAIKFVENKYQEKEEFDTFCSSFEVQVSSFSKANEAAKRLLLEMDKAEIKAVKLSGEGHPNNNIERLRTLLTQHLTSLSGTKYESKKQLWAAGAYTKESLATLIAESSALAEKYSK
jgi:hypothetical protein